MRLLQHAGNQNAADRRPDAAHARRAGWCQPRDDRSDGVEGQGRADRRLAVAQAGLIRDDAGDGSAEARDHIDEEFHPTDIDPGGDGGPLVGRRWA